MKTVVFFVILILLSAITLAQEQKKEIDEIRVTPPKFTGLANTATIYSTQNFTSFEDFLKANLKYPDEALKYAAQGTEVVRFEVSADGKLTNFEVVNSVWPEIDLAVYDFLKTTCGMWQPGKNNGEPVSMQKEISIQFELTKTKDFDLIATRQLAKGTKQLFEKDNPQKALRHFNRGIKYRPNEDCLLVSRGICKYELGDSSGARSDWERMAVSGIQNEVAEKVENFNDFKGYQTLLTFLDNYK